MKKPTRVGRRFWVAGLTALCVTAANVPPVEAQQTTVQTPQVDAQEILRRLTELEALVIQSRAETARLRAELEKTKKEQLRGGDASTSGLTTAAGAVPVATSPSDDAEEDEWGEPEVEVKQGGRDTEARRRLTELETQMRKVAAKTTKEEEEQKRKVKFDFSGKYKPKFNTRANFHLDNPLQKWSYDDSTFFDHRYQLQVDATYEQFLTRFLLDKGNFVFDWKEGGEGTAERWGQFHSVGSPLVRELYVQYTGDFMARLGRQNWIVGNSITLEGPVDAIRVDYPLGKLPWGRTTMSAGYIAIAGGWNSYTEFLKTGPPAGDREAVFSVENKLDAYYLGLDIRPTKTLQLNPYVLKAIDRGDDGDADLNLDKDFNASTTPRDGDFEPQWTGLRATLDLDDYQLDGEAIYLSGNYTSTDDLSAHALLIRGTRDFGEVGFLESLTAGLEFGRGSGSFSGLFLCKDRHKFGNIFSEDIHAGYFLWSSNLSNITYARIETTLEPFDGLKLTPSFTNIWTTEEVFEGRGPIGDWSRGTATTSRTTNDVGWELDLNVTYPVLDNLDVFASLGYLQPGLVYARPDGTTPDAAFEMILGGEVKF